MKKIFRYTRQPRPYADSYGEMLIELEDGDDKDKIIEEIHKRSRESGGWNTDHFYKELTEFSYNNQIIRGKLLLFKSFDRYTG